MDTNMIKASIKADLEFCRESPEEFKGHAAMVRTTAALNPAATRSLFIETMVELGVNPDTARIQFVYSRKLSAECGEIVYADGSMECL